MWRLELNSTKKGRLDENATELNTGNDESGEYKVKAVCDSTVYAKESKDHLLRLYYLIF